MWYVLDADNNPVPELDMLKAAEFFNDFPRRCVSQHEVDGSFVSTVFLGLNHDFGRTGRPVLFETLVEGGPLDQHMERYHTWSEAVAGHFGILRLLAERTGRPFYEISKAVVPPERRTRYEVLQEDEDLV